ncbi:glycosyltransferase family 39 protein [bacterium]|nr:glycosyltransferase family 39 protein [bacterium]
MNGISSSTVPGRDGTLGGGVVISAALVLLCVGAIILLRLPYCDGGLLKSDEAVYAVTARAWSQGLLPGRDTWDNKPPGMAAAYLLAARLPGGMIAGSRLLALLLAAVTLLVTLRLARLAAPTLPVWPVAVAYVLITHANGWPAPEWVVLNGEWPSTALVALSALCLAEWTRRGDGWWVLLAGVWGGMALLFRQTALVPMAALGLWLIWVAARRGGGRDAGASVGLAMAGTLLAWAPLVAYYTAHGAQSYLWPACGGWGLAYAEQRVGWADGWRNACGSLGVGLLPALAGLGLLGAVLAVVPARWGEAGRGVAVPTLRWLLVALGLGSALAVLPGGRLFDHYFLQAAPPWALAVGLGAAQVRRWPRCPLLRSAAGVMLALGVLAVGGRLLLSHPDNARAVMDEASQEVFAAVADTTQARTRPTDRILVWAWAPQVYWYANRLPAARDLTLNYALGWIGREPGELFPGAAAALRADLCRTRPPIIVKPTDDAVPFGTSPAWQPGAAPLVWAFVRQNYRQVQHLPHWEVYELRAGVSAGRAEPPAHDPLRPHRHL